MPVILGRWGGGRDSDDGGAQLLSAGADAVGTSLVETITQLHPLIPLAVGSARDGHRVG